MGVVTIQNSGKQCAYPRSEFALGQKTDEQVLHAVLVIIIGWHVQTSAGLIHVSTHTHTVKACSDQWWSHTRIYTR